jgi:xylulokinase
MYLLGYDAGTSSIKATLMEAPRGRVVASATHPPKEMAILSKAPGWAEQNPADWWVNLKAATARILADAKVNPSDIKAIGITYQMHGLVCVDKHKAVLRPSIIWCDSRAVTYGQKAAQRIGKTKCLEIMLNHPGNFTAAKLAWVKDNEPDIYTRIDKIMLPGDYLAMKMTDRIVTTKSGLSEGILWDFSNKRLARPVMEAFGFEESFIPEVKDTFCIQGQLTPQAADELGLAAGTVVSYRAGDQPNNAWSLGVLDPGQVAATAGTSGVVYGISDRPCYDEKSRVNTFVHVNNTDRHSRYGSLLCINGTGILNSWLKHNAAGGLDYPKMNEMAAGIGIGSEGLCILPYGNGAERTLENRLVDASIYGLNFNVHTQAHLFRAAQEGIVFAFYYGLGIMKQMGMDIRVVRAGRANMFQSEVFGKAFASVTGALVELYNTDGSQGAARGAGYGAGLYSDVKEAFTGLEKVDCIEPDASNKDAWQQAYDRWLDKLNRQISRF